MSFYIEAYSLKIPYVCIYSFIHSMLFITLLHSLFFALCTDALSDEFQHADTLGTVHCSLCLSLRYLLYPKHISMAL